jgi:hypothetical protein
MCRAPKRAAARVGAAPPDATMSCSEPMGARITGSRSFWPKILAPASIFSTLRRTRGRKASESMAVRFLT